MTVLVPRSIALPARRRENPPEAPQRRLRRRTLLCLLGFPAAALCAAVLVWFRLPPMAHDTVWAEDGRLFLFGAEQHGLFGATFVPYAGYLQFVPRLIAGAVVQWLPTADWALGMTAGACLVTGAIACVVKARNPRARGSRPCSQPTTARTTTR